MLEDTYILNANVVDGNFTKSIYPFTSNILFCLRDNLRVGFYKYQNSFKINDHSNFIIQKIQTELILITTKYIRVVGSR
jgi:hypothetical protein